MRVIHYIFKDFIDSIDSLVMVISSLEKTALKRPDHFTFSSGFPLRYRYEDLIVRIC